MRFTDNAALVRWLDTEVHAFEDAFPVAFVRSGAFFRLVIARHVSGRFEAGSTQTFRDYALSSDATTGLAFPEGARVGVGHCCQGVDVVDVPTGDGVGFVVDIPDRLTVRALHVDVEELGERRRIVAPYASDREIDATFAGSDVPHANMWREAFRAQGVEVVWRAYGEPGEDVAFDYVGWALQEKGRTPVTRSGLVCTLCRAREGTVDVRFERGGDDVSDALWGAVGRVFAAIDGARVTTGNCQFAIHEWQAFVASGEFPARMGRRLPR